MSRRGCTIAGSPDWPRKVKLVLDTEDEAVNFLDHPNEKRDSLASGIPSQLKTKHLAYCPVHLAMIRMGLYHEGPLAVCTMGAYSMNST